MALFWIFVLCFATTAGERVSQGFCELVEELEKDGDLGGR